MTTRRIFHGEDDDDAATGEYYGMYRRDLPPPAHKPATRGPTPAELERLHELRELNLASRPEKQWAYNLLERHRRGERVDWYPLRMAREVVAADRSTIDQGASTVEPKRCPYCDDTGDVHGLDGEWRGRCTCPIGRAAAAAEGLDP